MSTYSAALFYFFLHYITRSPHIIKNTEIEKELISGDLVKYNVKKLAAAGYKDSVHYWPLKKKQEKEERIAANSWDFVFVCTYVLPHINLDGQEPVFYDSIQISMCGS